MVNYTSYIQTLRGWDIRLGSTIQAIYRLLWDGIFDYGQLYKLYTDSYGMGYSTMVNYTSYIQTPRGWDIRLWPRCYDWLRMYMYKSPKMAEVFRLAMKIYFELQQVLQVLLDDERGARGQWRRVSLQEGPGVSGHVSAATHHVPPLLWRWTETCIVG